MHILTKRGNLDNIITYEHICDTTEDMAFIEQKYITLGSTCVVLQGDSGGMEVYMADSNKEWHDIMVTGGNEMTTSGLELHVCTAAEVQNGKPNIETPLESTLYLVPSGAESGNLYDEYVYVNQQWELFGGARVNMDGYATESWVQQQNYLTSVPHATDQAYGTIKLGTGLAPIVDGQGNDNGVGVMLAPNSIIKQGTQTSWAVPVSGAGAAAFYGLAKAAGDTTQAQSSNAVGTYTDAAKTAIQEMLDVPSNNALAAVDTLPAPGENGTALVSVNGEWQKQTGYGYKETGEYILGEFTAADFIQEDEKISTGYYAPITLTEELYDLLVRMFQDKEEFNVQINDTIYNSIKDNFVYDMNRPSISLDNVFTLTPSLNEIDFAVPGSKPEYAKIYNSITTYTEFDKKYLPSANIINGAGSKALILNATEDNNYNTADGDCSVAEGSSTSAIGNSSHAEGSSTLATGDNSHAEGLLSIAIGAEGHAEGRSNAFGSYTHSEGYSKNGAHGTIVVTGVASGNVSNKYTVESIPSDLKENAILYTSDSMYTYLVTEVFSDTLEIKTNKSLQNTDNATYYYATAGAYGDSSHVEGSYTVAIGNSAHAEGAYTKAYSNNSHAEGEYTNTNGNGSHAEGQYTIASGTSSHAEGYNTKAYGYYSHAEGRDTQTESVAHNSHVEGLGTIASASNQHVEGKYNIRNSEYAHIVGNGTSNIDRSNAYTLDRSGNGWFAGKVSVGTVNNPVAITNPNDLTTKQYVDNALAAKVNALAAKVVSVEGTTPEITAVADTQYICGEVSTLSFTPAATGISDIIFESGSTATVLTVPNTVKFPDWFDATALEPNMVYEISIMNGTYGAVMAWPAS